jgi:hypothetical protein
MASVDTILESSDPKVIVSGGEPPAGYKFALKNSSDARVRCDAQGPCLW